MTETDNSIIKSQPKQLYMIYDEKKRNGIRTRIIKLS